MIHTMPLPTIEAGENFAEVGLAAWIAEFGGVDVTEPVGGEDYGPWIGAVRMTDGSVVRVNVDDSGLMWGEIRP